MEACVERFLRDQGGLLKQFEVLFQDELLEKLARESRFIERSTSKLSGWMFLELHLLMTSSGKEFSLNQMCQELEERHGVALTKQSLDERFNTFAVKFIHQCFAYVLTQVLDFKQNGVSHPHFKRVILTDSTSFQLPAHLAAFYRSNGGSTTGASIKIHQRYELLNGSVLQLEIRDGKENDAALLQTVDYSQAREELHLLDLGYFKLAHLQTLDQAGGFFISRYKTGTNVFVKDEAHQFKKLDWHLWFEQLQAGQASCLSEVYLGEEKLKVRLLAEKLEEEAAQKRLTKISRKEANQSSKSKYHYQNSELKKLLAGYNIFITNTTEEQLSPAQISLYYKLRWQIELLFKIWKSIIEIDKVGKMSIFRFECYLYSRLIAILLSSHLHSMFKACLEAGEDFELSEWKVIKYLKKS
jgi:Transposase DDE domain